MSFQLLYTCILIIDLLLHQLKELIVVHLYLENRFINRFGYLFDVLVVVWIVTCSRAQALGCAQGRNWCEW